MRFLADENFDGRIYRGLLRRDPALDILRVVDVGLAETDDATILAWAADDQRLILTHDVTTMGRFAYDRVRLGLKMPGVIMVSRDMNIAQVIDDLLLLSELSEEGEWEGQVIYLPLY